MKYGYIVKITGQNIYNEAQLATSMTAYSVGTRIESDLRFRKDFFFEEFELSFRNQNGKWSFTCSDNIFLDFGDIRKLARGCRKTRFCHSEERSDVGIR